MGFFDLTGKVAIVTGGGSGMGREVALEYSSSGAAVVVSSNVREEDEAVAQACRDAGGTALAISADVSEEEAVRTLVARTLRELGRVDVLVAAAGIDIRESRTPTDAFVERTTLEQWQRVLSVNLTGTFLCIREVLRPMLEQGSGSIVGFTSSTVGRAIPGVGAYVATKAGLEGLTHVLALELAGRGVRANTMHPGGPTDTGLFPAWVTDELRAGMHRPRVVRAVAGWLACDESRDVTGQALAAAEFNRERGIDLCPCATCAA